MIITERTENKPVKITVWDQINQIDIFTPIFVLIPGVHPNIRMYSRGNNGYWYRHGAGVVSISNELVGVTSALVITGDEVFEQIAIARGLEAKRAEEEDR